jgi:hypothetical protein
MIPLRYVWLVLLALTSMVRTPNSDGWRISFGESVAVTGNEVETRPVPLFILPNWHHHHS